MKKLASILWIYRALCSQIWAMGAAADVQPIFDVLLEEVYNHCPVEVPYEVLQERLWERYHAPLDLNQAAREELEELGVLTDEQLAQFFKHVAQHGPLIAIYELQAVPDFDLSTIRRLLPFVKVGERYASTYRRGLGTRMGYGLVRHEYTLEPKKGYLPNKKTGRAPYVGSPHGFLARLHLKHPTGWGLGGIVRKKGGEPVIWAPAAQHYGPPVVRLYGKLKPQKNLQTLIVGDYAVGYGEGLVLNAGFSIHKSSETVKVIRTNNIGIRPHTSLSEAAFRGVAATWRWQPVECTAYCSAVALDGRLRKEADGSPYVSSISRGGYYRTDNDLAKKGQVKEQVIGGTLVYKSPTESILVGINTMHSHYSLPIHPKNSGNPRRFTGQHHTQGSVFYRYLWQNLYFFGEGGWSTNRSLAALAGVVASISRSVDATVLWRNYGQGFYAPYGNAFRENSTGNNNEQGLYLGARIRPWQRWCLDASYDYFYFPWLQGQPSAGYGVLAKATYEPQKVSSFSFQYKVKVKGRCIPKTTEVAKGLKNNYKFRYNYQLSRAVRLTSEVQWSSYHWCKQVTSGYAAVQDVAYKIRQLQLKGRVAGFCTEDWNNRLTFYEPHVLYAGFNFPPYHGKGMRYCLLAVYKPTASFRLEMKYLLTYYFDRDKVGSGQEKIEGHIKNEVWLQAVLRF